MVFKYDFFIKYLYVVAAASLWIA